MTSDDKVGGWLKKGIREGNLFVKKLPSSANSALIRLSKVNFEDSYHRASIA